MVTDETTPTRFNVPPSEAEWYYCATVDLHGETDYIDGYAAGVKPTRTAFQEASRCNHTWIAGMMHVHSEDVESVAAIRPVECERCDRPYSRRNENPYKILEWEVKPTPNNPKYRGPSPEPQ